MASKRKLKRTTRRALRDWVAHARQGRFNDGLALRVSNGLIDLRNAGAASNDALFQFQAADVVGRQIALARTGGYARFEPATNDAGLREHVRLQFNELRQKGALGEVGWYPHAEAQVVSESTALNAIGDRMDALVVRDLGGLKINWTAVATVIGLLLTAAGVVAAYLLLV